MTKIGCGNDSTVYLPEHEQYVVKIYDGMIGEMDTETKLKFLNRYVSDTLEASEIISKHSPMKTFRSGWKNYSIIISIPPLGEIQEISSEDIDDTLRLGHRMYHAAVGQKYVRGESVGEIFSKSDRDMGEGIFYDSINSFRSSVKGSLRYVHELLNEKMGIEFIVGYANLKPVLDEKNKILRLEITDLADSILAMYNGHV